MLGDLFSPLLDYVIMQIMSTLGISLVAILLYLAAAFRIGINLLRGSTIGSAKVHMLVLGLIAVSLHGIILYQAIITGTGLNLGIFNAASLVTWLIAVFILFASLLKPLETLAIVLLPLAALAIGLELLFPSLHLLPEDAPLGLRIHVMLSLLAYSLLAIAALQALALALEDRLLRQRRPLRMMRILPPLQTLEFSMFQIIAFGFFLLSLGLISGLMFLKDMFAQHLVHKTVLSIIAWLVFAILLWGRHRFGWRGRTAIRYALSGFGSLMLAYFGSKLVLELILHRG
jgi:ABC-type uncharacterized transport system permease subunit